MRKVLFAFCLGAGLAWGEVGFRDSVIRRANEETGKGGKGGKGEAVRYDIDVAVGGKDFVQHGLKGRGRSSLPMEMFTSH